MVARAEMLGDTGANHPDHWVGGLASPDLHALVILFARESRNASAAGESIESSVAQCEGVEVLSSLDLEATPPFDYAHDHFGYRDRLSQPVIEGSGEEPTPGSRRAAQGGRVHPRLPGRRRSRGQPAASRKSSRRNGSYMAYRRLQEHVGAFRDFLREHGRRPRSRNSWRRSSWAAGAAARRSCWRPTRTIRRWGRSAAEQ